MRTVLYFISTFLLGTSWGKLDSILDTCCLEGTDLAEREERCDNHPGQIPGIEDHDQLSCMSIIEVCCVKKKQADQCEFGMSDALQYSQCAIRDDVFGSEQYKECCLCCRLGLTARNSGLPCVGLTRFGGPCDNILTECCTGITPGNPFDNSSVTTGTGHDQVDECRMFPDRLCSHVCVDTPGSYRCECNEGYVLARDERTCTEATAVSTCDVYNPCAHNCEETDIGIRCHCRAGYRLTNDRFNCEDINECDDRTYMCGVGEECVNEVGRYRCQSVGIPQCPEGSRYNPSTGVCQAIRPPITEQCRAGYIFNTESQRCEDINECEERTHSCTAGERCINEPGRYQCQSVVPQCPEGARYNPDTRRCEATRPPVTQQCPSGFDLSTQSQSCEDKDECALREDNCPTSQRCENTVGSYACRRITGCGTGYTLNEESQDCVDQDECASNVHNCRSGYICQNYPGSFRCVPKECPVGFRFNPSTGQCVEITCPTGQLVDPQGSCADINECETPNICRRHQQCVNTPGSYHCRDIINCGHGYEIDSTGVRCVDIDECATRTHECQFGQNCINRPGSYICQCPEGYRNDGTGRCTDVDECRYGSTCPHHSQCKNTPGSFECVCNDGLRQEGRQCKDIDECAETGRCHHSCVNVVGSYHCTCNVGYQLSVNQRTCEDIDECSQFAGRGRLCGGECINTPGSYSCTCPSGWRLLGNGRSCQDVDECAESTAECSGIDSMCFNTRGSYKCPHVECPTSFVRTPLGPRRNSVRCKRVSFTCRQGDQECLNAPLSLSFNFLTFPTNVKIPTDLFSMSGPQTSEKIFDWNLEVLSVRPQHAGVQSVNRGYFDLKIGRNDAKVSLESAIPGPQDIELKLSMMITDRYSGYTGTAISKIYLYVTGESILS